MKECVVKVQLSATTDKKGWRTKRGMLIYSHDKSVWYVGDADPMLESVLGVREREVGYFNAKVHDDGTLEIQDEVTTSKYDW